MRARHQERLEGPAPRRNDRHGGNDRRPNHRALPEGPVAFTAGYTRLLTRITAYTALVCDAYPSFSGADDPTYPVRMQFAGPLLSYSRLMEFSNSYIARSDAYLLLLTETYPPFQQESSPYITTPPVTAP